MTRAELVLSACQWSNRTIPRALQCSHRHGPLRVAYALRMDSIEVRRVWLRHGGDYTAAARELGCKRQTVTYHVARAHKAAPLTYQAGDPADREAVGAYMRAVLARAGVAVR